MESSVLVFRAVPAPVHSGSRTRRSHRKSRNGCINCKTRKVKCDETEGQCLRCRQRNLLCKYDTSNPESRPALRNTNSYHASIQPRIEPTASLASHAFNSMLIQESLTSSTGQKSIVFRVRELHLLHNFHANTCQSVGDTRIQHIYQTDVLQLAIQNPFLMYPVLAFSALHVGYMRSEVHLPSNLELYYWQRSLEIFRERLSRPMCEDQADAMLAAATLINGIAFAMTRESEPDRSWPLSDATGSDLQWLRVQGGIDLVLRSILPSTSPYRSLFQLSHEEIRPPTDSIVHNVDSSSEQWFPLVIRLREICECENKESSINNPYQKPLLLLEPLLRRRCMTSSDVIAYLGFIGSAPDDFIDLLQAKDHRALLLLGLWYATICSAPCWWSAPRSQLECKSIMMYLDRNADESIREILSLPAEACGYVLQNQTSNSAPEFGPLPLCPVM